MSFWTCITRRWKHLAGGSIRQWVPAVHSCIDGLLPLLSQRLRVPCLFRAVTEVFAVVIDVAMWVALYWRNYDSLWQLGRRLKTLNPKPTV